MKVLVATDKPFAKVAVDGIRREIEAAGYELVLLEKYGEKAKLLEAVKDANAIIIRSDIIDAEVLDAAKELKIVVRAGAGYDNVDLEAATAHNVCVMNTPGQNSNAVAELAFGLMVMAVRNMYNGTSGTELMGKKLGSSMLIVAENGSVKIGGQYMNEVEYCHIKDYEMPELAPTNPGNDYGPYKGSAQNHNFVIRNVVNVLSGAPGEIITTNVLEGMKVVDIIRRIYAGKA
jgi:hypothetical protein